MRIFPGVQPGQLEERQKSRFHLSATLQCVTSPIRLLERSVI
jgi:hypothetical protein